MEKMDYTDPQCPFCVDEYKEGPTVHPIDVATAIAKIDEHLNRDDYEAAERVLNYWIGEAKLGHDDRGLLSLRNEQMGLLRKLGRGDEAMAAGEEALALIDKIGFDGTITAATTYVNVGTVQKTFGSSKLAIEYDEKALAVLTEYFERACEQADDNASDADGDAAGVATSEIDDYAMRLGSLYNNMALALADEKRYGEAEAAYEAALKVMARMTHGEREQAITYLNLADLVLVSTGAKVADDGSHVESYPDSETELKILEYVGRAKELLDTESLPRDGYHAFVLEKCAHTFAFYGFSGVASEYEKISREIYNKA